MASREQVCCLVWKGSQTQEYADPCFRKTQPNLPLKQGCKPFGSQVVCIFWSRSDIRTTLDCVVQDHETDVFIHSLHRIIQWDVFARLLHKDGVDKDEAEIRRVHSSLSRNCYPGFTSHTLSKWRFIWTRHYLLKETSRAEHLSPRAKA